MYNKILELEPYNIKVLLKKSKKNLEISILVLFS